MHKKNATGTFLVCLLAMSLSIGAVNMELVPGVKAENLQIYVNPSSYVFSSASGIGQLFNVTCWVSTTRTDLGGVQVCMEFNDSILAVTKWYVPDSDVQFFMPLPYAAFPGPPDPCYVHVGPSLGRVTVAIQKGGSPPSAPYGYSGKVCILEFERTALPSNPEVNVTSVLNIDNMDTFAVESGGDRVEGIMSNGYYVQRGSAFRIGDQVRTTANLNVREGPGLGYALIDTMPEGALGQIMDGPVEADGHVWWEVEYALGEIGWSVQDWLELLSLPLVQGKDVPVMAPDFFPNLLIGLDIFASEFAVQALTIWADHEQTNAYWNPLATTWDMQSKSWDFNVEGVKNYADKETGIQATANTLTLACYDCIREMLAARFFNEQNLREAIATWSGLGSGDSYVISLVGKWREVYPVSVITSPLRILSSSNYPWKTGDRLLATFQITNRRSVSITFDELVVGGRNPDGEVVDFDKTDSPVTINPDSSYDYKGDLTIPAKSGFYYFFCAYHTVEHLSGEDENNWNTKIPVELEGRLLATSDADRYRAAVVNVAENLELIPIPVVHPVWEKIDEPITECPMNYDYELAQLVVAPNDPETVYALVKWKKPFVLDDSVDIWVADEIYKWTGGTWAEIARAGENSYRLLSKEVNVITIAPTDSRMIYAGCSDGVYRSLDGGETWNSLDGPKTGWWAFKHCADVRSIAIDFENPSVIYAGTVEDGVWKKDEGNEWKKVSESSICSTAHITSTTPYSRSFLYESAFGVNPDIGVPITTSAGILKSENGGSTWKRAWFSGLVTSIACAGTDKEIVYASTGPYLNYFPAAGSTQDTAVPYPTDSTNRLLRYDGNGDWSVTANWHDATGKDGKNPLPKEGLYYSLALNPHCPSTIFVAVLGEGAYYSMNSGDDWYSLGLENSLPYCRIVLGTSADSQILYAFGSKGIFRLRLSDTATIVKEHSAGELRIRDSLERVTGLVNCELKEEIPNSLYANRSKTIIIFNCSGDYRYEIFGTSNGTYGLEIVTIQNGMNACFEAINIPVHQNTTHQYTVDWAVLSRGGEGATIRVDSDGDGGFEYNFTSDNELNRLEYVAATTKHDLGITGMTSSERIIGAGYSHPINMTVMNYGVYTETINVTIYANTTLVALQTVDLASGNSTTLTFNWNTTGFAKGNYTVWTYAEPVQGETYTVDNNLTGGWVKVTIVGDVNGDGKVNLIDVFSVALAYGSYPGHPAWNPNCDINSDCKINLIDYFITALNYGKTDT